MKSVIRVLPGLPLLFLPTLAQAELPYTYSFLEPLASQMTEDDGLFENGADDRSGGLRLGLGYRANYWLGVEGSVQSLGRFDTGETEVRYGAMTVSGLFYVPIVTRTFEPYARVGGGFATVESGFRRTERGFTRSNDTKPVWAVGGGLQVNFSDTFAMRVGADRHGLETRVGGSIDDDGNLQRADQRIDSAYLGLKWMFR